MIMKKILLALLICAGVASCKDDDPGTEPPKPTVSLTEGTSTTTSITFTVTPDEAEKCAYLYAKVEENVQVEQPSAETVLKDGVQVAPNKPLRSLCRHWIRKVPISFSPPPRTVLCSAK